MQNTQPELMDNGETTSQPKIEKEDGIIGGAKKKVKAICKPESQKKTHKVSSFEKAPRRPSVGEKLIASLPKLDQAKKLSESKSALPEETTPCSSPKDDPLAVLRNLPVKKPCSSPARLWSEVAKPKTPKTDLFMGENLLPLPPTWTEAMRPTDSFEAQSVRDDLELARLRVQQRLINAKIEAILNRKRFEEEYYYDQMFYETTVRQRVHGVSETLARTSDDLENDVKLDRYYSVARMLFQFRSAAGYKYPHLFIEESLLDIMPVSLTKPLHLDLELEKPCSQRLERGSLLLGVCDEKQRFHSYSSNGSSGVSSYCSL